MASSVACGEGIMLHHWWEVSHDHEGDGLSDEANMSKEDGETELP